MRWFYLWNMFLTLLTLIAIKLVERFLHPTKTAIRTATYAQSFLLFCIKDAPAIMTTTSTHAQNLLLLSVQDDPAITMTNHANSKLQLIVEYLLLPRNFERQQLRWRHTPNTHFSWLLKVSFCFVTKTTRKLWLQVSCSFASKTHQQLWWWHTPTTHCRYRFRWKAISTYMSLSLARLCGEWRLSRD